ncbi:basic proline-rich protein-like [Phyllostomus hastatus]|uniref:basic proline-rich protein-like n=1 Tax=Phyllostomus hastatus TaxID=9423 RepID=UPI001E680574|nr:basic proline-rich protein-like [Phyllostomus hastatus]
MVSPTLGDSCSEGGPRNHVLLLPVTEGPFGVTQLLPGRNEPRPSLRAHGFSQMLPETLIQRSPQERLEAPGSMTLVDLGEGRRSAVPGAPASPLGTGQGGGDQPPGAPPSLTCGPLPTPGSRPPTRQLSAGPPAAGWTRPSPRKAAPRRRAGEGEPSRRKPEVFAMRPGSPCTPGQAAERRREPWERTHAGKREEGVGTAAWKETLVEKRRAERA